MPHVVVVGAGTIGSHVLPHIARIPGVDVITIIDRDRYEAANLATQNIFTLDVGKSKAQVQARRVKSIDGSIDVRPIHAPVEDVPLGWLRADVILACLDSRRARMVVNQAAWRLGVPWIDAGVDASGLARVQAFLPALETACLECAWDTRDYELVEQDYPCRGAAGRPATGASAALGALAGSLQALECQKLLSGSREYLLEGRNVLIDVNHHRHYLTRFTRNAACRMPDHAGWRIDRSDADPCATTLADLIAITRSLTGSGSGVRMRVAGQEFAMARTCQQCHARSAAGYLYRGDRRRSAAPCRDCGGSLAVSGFDLHDSVILEDLPKDARNRSISELGLQAGDVLTFSTSGTERHLELRGTVWPIES
jgi:molybdopterin/thiamine biosynthesis adenylyltransferase